MDYRALIASSLLEIGVQPDQVRLIDSGAEMYGDAGLLDSLHLLSLIVAIEEALSNAFDAPSSLFREEGVGLLDQFRDVNTLASFLERHVTTKASAVHGRLEVHR